jgi:DNA repair exonuclease SbcCD ATPase subunit
LLQTAEGSLAEVQSQNAKFSEELDEAQKILDESSRRFNCKTKELEAKVKAETERNSKLHEGFENLRNKCAHFATRCANRLKGIFNSVGAASEEINPSAKDIPRAFDHIENEVEALDEVITRHRDFCALVASRVIAASFMKAGCTHAKTVNKPTFNLSMSDIVDIPAEA